MARVKYHLKVFVKNTNTVISSKMNKRIRVKDTDKKPDIINKIARRNRINLKENDIEVRLLNYGIKKSQL